MRNRLSIIIPVYKYTKEQLNRTYLSLLEQDDDDFEVVFSLEGIEGPKEIYWKKELPDNMRVLWKSDVHGPSVARNIGVLASTGDIITYADMGDELYSDRVGHVKQAFEYMPKMNILFSAYTMVHPTAGESDFNPQEKAIKVLKTKETARTLFRHGGLCPAVAVAHRRKPFLLLGGFQPGIYSGEEGILWRRFSDKLPPETVAFTDYLAGKKHFQDYNKKDFEGFEVDTEHKSGPMGQYLDKDWFKEYV